MSSENSDSYFFSESESSSAENTNNETCISFPISINENLLQSITKILLKIISNNSALPNYKKILEEQMQFPYSTLVTPGISLYEYLYRIKYYSEVEDNTLIISLMYIDRLCKLGKIVLIENNLHRLFFTSILIAIKYNEDNIYDNKYYAKIAGINIKELNLLEKDFCNQIEFNFYIEHKHFEHYQSCLSNLINGK
jgi:hypothetical protein